MPNDFDPYSEWLGIPPEEQPADHYRLLGIEQFESDTELIKKAAEAKIEYLRTFQLGGKFSFSQKLMAEVASALVCLRNSEKKAAYDALLRGHSESAQEKAPVGPPSPLTPDRTIEPQATPTLPGDSESPVAPLPDDWGASQSAPARPRRKKRTLAPIIGLVVVTLTIIGAGITLYLSGEARKQRLAQVAEEEADRKAKEEAERKAKEEADHKAKEEAQRKAKEEAERKAKKEAERKAEAERTTKVTHWPNGQKESEGHYKNGKLEGLTTIWHANGRKKSEGHYKDGELDGLWTQWHENGQKEREGHVKDGKEDGLWTYWRENGQKEREAHYKNGKLEGLTTIWHANGRKKSKGHYKDGELDGLWTLWHENGQKSEHQYKDGKLISRKDF